MTSITDDLTPSASADDFPIVAIGASAGGLEAIRQLFGRVPTDTGMAFVVIQHLDPSRPSLLASVLGTELRMPVVEVADGMAAQPDHVYVIPPDADLDVHGRILRLVERGAGSRLHLPIDAFMTALAEDQPDRCIGVVLSGSGSDGTEGLRAIRAAGGLALAQAPESAQFRSMPESAIAAGVVDFQGPSAELGDQLARLGHHPYLLHPPAANADEPAPSSDAEPLAVILTAIARHARIDLRGYKRSTIMRRIARRMALGSSETLAAYAELVRDDPDEARALTRDVFIHVTSFFRDPDAFAVLEHEILPRIVERKRDGGTIRVWVPGCSTGQEAYSIAICLFELLERREHSVSVKIFGSDVSETAITVARAGVYAEHELAGVSPERRARCFERIDAGYRVIRPVREVCVFASHDLTRDPPFHRLDLISCRNVLIYFDAELQRRILPMLHHSLETQGYLFLGRSESIGAAAELFTPVDSRHRFFLKVGESPRLEHPGMLGSDAESRPTVHALAPGGPPSSQIQRQADHLLLARYAPPGVIVDDKLQVVQFRGRTGAFLEPPPGHPQTSILRMARGGLVGRLHEAIEEAKARSATVRRERVRVDGEGGSRVIDLEVVPLTGLAQSKRHFLVLFEAAAPGPADGRAPLASAAPPERGSPHEELARIESELAATRDYLHLTLAEHEDATEELAAANEEMVAANEELQATNEELESAKEELQSTNEELVTVNDELRSRNQELDLVAADLAGVLESVEIPVIIVDHELRIRRFTPTAREVSWILPSDVGRSIEEVKLKLDVDDLADHIAASIQGAAPKEWEIQTRDGRWLRLRIRPYRTAGHHIRGAILSFVDVDLLKRAVHDAERARDYSRAVVETVLIPLLVLDADMRIVSANHAFCRAFELTPTAVESVGLFELMGGTFNVPGLHHALERVVDQRSPLRGFEVEIGLPSGVRRLLSLSGSAVGTERGGLLVLALEDVTARRMLEASEREARLEAERSSRAKDLFLATLSHELRTPLSTILTASQVLDGLSTGDPSARRSTAAIGRAVANLTTLIDDLLDISRIVSGKLMLELEAVELATVVREAVEVVQPRAEAQGLELQLELPASAGRVRGDPSRLRQVVANLLDNAIKFTPRGGKVAVRVEVVDGQVELTVRDTGIGVRAEVLPHLFERFVQGEGTLTRGHGGLGLGLAIVRHLVHVHGGEVRAESPGPGKGTTFRVTLPRLVPEVRSVAVAAPSTVARSIQGLRVLLVEDDDDAREVFAMMLGRLGADVRAVSSSGEALAALDGQVPQVILCDIAMPSEDGYTFARKLRSRTPERGGVIPAAALTALASHEDRERSLRAGFQMHLTKPIDAASLAAAVGNLAAMQVPAAPPA